MFDRSRARLVALPAAALAFALSSPSPVAGRDTTTFTVTYQAGVNEGPVSARVYVMLGPAKGGEPRFGPNWFRPQPFFAVDAKGWKPGEPLNVGADATGFPGPLDTLEPGEYQAQAVVRLNPDTHKLGNGEGNAYGPPVMLKVEAGKGDAVALTVDKVVPRRKFPETDRIKLVEIESPMLSAFHKRKIMHRAAVILPEGDPETKRGTLYIIPGFGGDHTSAPRVASDARFGFGKELIRVLLDPDCGTGHHVFADSAFNGPRGKALTEELIPYIEKTYPAIPEPRARLLNGHSSGGWSSLWLQVTYSDFFGGTWSTAPDPVDFRDFQKVDVYAPGENMYKDAEGKRRAVARMAGRDVIFYDSFSKLEDVIGDGGQLHSFEAVFSPLGANGFPRPLWDRKTGAIDPETAVAWRKYDIRLTLEKNWATLGPKLKGKIRVVTGELDTFFLDGPAKLLKAQLEALGSDAVVELVPGRDHGTVLDAKLAARFEREMNAALGNAPRKPSGLKPAAAAAPGQ